MCQQPASATGDWTTKNTALDYHLIHIALDPFGSYFGPFLPFLCAWLYPIGKSSATRCLPGLQAICTNP